MRRPQRPFRLADRILLRVPEAAEALAMGESTLWERIRTGEIRVVRDGGRTFISRRELERWAENKEQQ